MDLEGRVVLVTGAGSGIGFAIARRLAAEGAAVAVNYLGHADDARALARDLSENGPRSIAVAADVSEPREVASMVARTVTELGRLDVLVNNAGMDISAPILEITDEDWDRVVRVNLYGAFYCLRECGRVMRERGGGSIVNISSIHEDLPFPGFASYTAAKGGLRMLMRNAALELARDGIRVNNIAPGPIATPINEKTMHDPDKMRTLERLVPLGRMGTPEEVAELAAFLACDRSSYVTGATFTIDGGMMRYAEPV